LVLKKSSINCKLVLRVANQSLSYRKDKRGIMIDYNQVEKEMSPSMIISIQSTRKLRAKTRYNTHIPRKSHVLLQVSSFSLSCSHKRQSTRNQRRCNPFRNRNHLYSCNDYHPSQENYVVHCRNGRSRASAHLHLP
jgi:hypothetical protein